jgi:hypothetical protein
MDEATVTAMHQSLEEVRAEVRRALVRLDDKLVKLTSAQRDVEIEMEAVRDAAFDALAELRHVDKRLRESPE